MFSVAKSDVQVGECEDAGPHSGPCRQGQAGGGGQEGGEVPVQVGGVREVGEVGGEGREVLVQVNWRDRNNLWLLLIYPPRPTLFM